MTTEDEVFFPRVSMKGDRLIARKVAGIQEDSMVIQVFPYRKKKDKTRNLSRLVCLTIRCIPPIQNFLSVYSVPSRKNVLRHDVEAFGRRSANCFLSPGKRGYRIESAALGTAGAEAAFEDPVHQLSFALKDPIFRFRSSGGIWRSIKLFTPVSTNLFKKRLLIVLN